MTGVNCETNAVNSHILQWHFALSWNSLFHISSQGLTKMTREPLPMSVVMLQSCCSVINGSYQEVSVGSSPSGAKVFHNGVQVGTTPAVLDLKRKTPHTIRVERDGYHPYEVSLTRKTSGWVWGNLFFGGLIGLAVDAVNGSLYNLNPESLQTALLPLTATSTL